MLCRQPLRPLHDHRGSTVAAGDCADSVGIPTLQEVRAGALPESVEGIFWGEGGAPQGSFCWAGWGTQLWLLWDPLTQLTSSSLMLKLIPFSAYTLLLLAVGLSRVFVLAHFPHQVLGGIVAGEQGRGHLPPPPHPLEPPHIHLRTPQPDRPPPTGAALGWGLQAHIPATRSLGFFAATSLGLLLGSVALHRLMVAAGIDIDW